MARKVKNNNMEEKVIIFSKAIGKAIAIFGFDIFNNSRQLSAVLKDLLPDYPKEQQKILEANELKIAQVLLRLHSSRDINLESEIQIVCKRLEEELYFSSKIAEIVVKSYSDAIVEYEQNVEVGSKKQEVKEQRPEELLARKKRAEEDARLAKVTRSYEEAKSRLEEAKIRLERADRARKEAQKKLNECFGMEALTWTKVVNKKIEIYKDRYLNYQQALSYCNQIKVAYDSVVRSCAAECPKCHIIVRKSFNYCPECGADLSQDPSYFVDSE